MSGYDRAANGQGATARRVASIVEVTLDVPWPHQPAASREAAGP